MSARAINNALYQAKMSYWLSWVELSQNKSNVSLEIGVSRSHAEISYHRSIGINGEEGEVNFRGKSLVQSGCAYFNKPTIRVCRTCSLSSPSSIQFTSRITPKIVGVKAIYHPSPKYFLKKLSKYCRQMHSQKNPIRWMILQTAMKQSENVENIFIKVFTLSQCPVQHSIAWWSNLCCSSVDKKFNASDIAAVLRSEEDDGGCNLFGCACAAKRSNLSSVRSHMHFHVASTNAQQGASRLVPLSQLQQSLPSVKRAFLYRNAVFLERLCTDVSICECPCQCEWSRYFKRQELTRARVMSSRDGKRLERCRRQLWTNGWNGQHRWIPISTQFR